MTGSGKQQPKLPLDEPLTLAAVPSLPDGEGVDGDVLQHTEDIGTGLPLLFDQCRLLVPAVPGSRQPPQHDSPLILVWVEGPAVGPLCCFKILTTDRAPN